MIPTTRLSVLAALRGSTRREEAWAVFQSQYQHTIFRWCTARGLQEADAEDLTQDILIKLYRTLAEHDHDPDRGKFRSWLATVVHNAIRDAQGKRRRRPDAAGVGGTAFHEQLANVLTPGSTDDLATALEMVAEARVRAVLERVKSRVSEANWQAFHATVIEGRPAGDVAEEQGRALSAIYQAKYRIKELFEAEWGKESSPSNVSPNEPASGA